MSQPLPTITLSTHHYRQGSVLPVSKAKDSRVAAYYDSLHKLTGWLDNYPSLRDELAGQAPNGFCHRRNKKGCEKARNIKHDRFTPFCDRRTLLHIASEQPAVSQEGLKIYRSCLKIGRKKTAHYDAESQMNKQGRLQAAAAVENRGKLLPVKSWWKWPAFITSALLSNAFLKRSDRGLAG